MKQSSGKTMTKEEMQNFIKSVGRCETFYSMKMAKENHWYPTYFKAIRVTLKTLGYEYEFVEDVLRPALEDYYEKAYKETYK